MYAIYTKQPEPLTLQGTKTAVLTILLYTQLLLLQYYVTDNILKYVITYDRVLRPEFP